MLLQLRRITSPVVRNRLAKLRATTHHRNPAKHFRDLLKEEQPRLSVTSERIPMLMPPIGVGHDDEDNVLGRSDLPKSGEVINLYRKGNVLIADFGRVPKKVLDLVKGGVYDKVSCELWPKPPGEGKAKFRGSGWMLKRVALLGADVPGIYTLEEIPKPEEGIGIIRGVEIFEVGTHNDIKYDLDDLDDIVRNYWLNRPAEQKIKELVSRYLSRDAKKPLSDGAATSRNFKDNTPVFVFRDMKQTFSVSESNGRYDMNPDDIRRALVAQGLFEEDEVNAMPDSAIVKMATLCGIQNSDAAPKEPTPPKQAEPAPANNSDEEEAATPAPPSANNADAAPAKPAMYNARQMSQVIDNKLDQKLDLALKTHLAPIIAQFKDLGKTVATTQKKTDSIVAGSLRSEAVHFCDKLRTGKKLTHGMNADHAVEELYVMLAGSPGEFHFNDSAGKKTKGSALELFKAIMERAPAYENWDEIAGGPITPENTETRDDTVLKTQYAKFSDAYRSKNTFDQYKKSFADAKKLYGPGYSVEEYTS